MLLFLISVSFFISNNNKVLATTWDLLTLSGHNLSGFAWSENIGWISFNSADCDGTGGGGDDGWTDATNFACPVGDPIDNSWGVTVDRNTLALSGYAWSENVGWICFGSSCSLSASYNEGTGKFSGNAQIVSMGTDGVLSLSGSATDGSPYGLSWDSTNKKIRGYAWNGNAVPNTGIGWVSFNCDEGGPAGGNICGLGHDYWVEADLNVPPVVTSITFVPPDNPLTIGDVYTMRGVFSDDNDDNATVYLCTSDSFDYVNKTCDDINPFPVGIDSWCTGTTVAEGANSECVLANIIVSGLNNYYAFACDIYGACSPSSFSGSFQGNARPVVSAITTNPTQPNPIITAPDIVSENDSDLDVTVNFLDSEGGNHTLYVCSTANFTEGTGCDNTTWCSNLAPTGGNSLSCTYTAQEADAGNNDIYVFVCDANVCSTNQPAGPTPTFFVNIRPKVGVMSAPNFDPAAACANDPIADVDLEANLKWVFSDGDAGDRLVNYNIYLFNETDGNPSLNNDGLSMGEDAGCSGANPDNCSVKLISSSAGNNLQALDWNKSYSFKIKVFDGIAWSEESVFDHNPGLDILTNDAGVNTANSPDPGKTFTTYAQNFPIPNGSNVSFLPDPPSAGEEVRLTPSSQYFNALNPTTPLDCFGTGNCSYAWTTTDGSFKAGTQNNEQPIIIFNDDGSMNYDFTVTAPAGYSCSTGGETADVNKRLPSWMETY